MPTDFFKALFSFIALLHAKKPAELQEKKLAFLTKQCFLGRVKSNELFQETALAALAKKFREASGVTKAEAARKLQVSEPTIYNAEERSEMSLTKVRIRLIETYSPFKVVGPVFYLKKK